jgi:hypothetical protein
MVPMLRALWSPCRRNAYHCLTICRLEETAELNDFKDLVFRGAHAPWSGSTQSHAGLQQFSGVTAQDSSRFHAGNSYVEHQNNYYAPNTMTPQALNSESQDVLALLSALEFPDMNLRRVIIEKEFPGTCT